MRPSFHKLKFWLPWVWLRGLTRGGILRPCARCGRVGIKHLKGRLRLPRDPEAWFDAAIVFHGLKEVPVSGRIAALSTQLPPLHKDPADRMIIATAQVQGMTILTPDPLIRDYPDVLTAW